MTSRGFIGPVDGKIRMRWAKPGFDARDMSLEANKIAFDSEYPGVMNLLASYQYSPPNGTTKWPTTETRLIAWPDYGYFPLANITYQRFGNMQWTVFIREFVHTQFTPNFDVHMKLKRDGLYVRAIGQANTHNIPKIRVALFGIPT